MAAARRKVVANPVDTAKHRAGGKIRPRHLLKQIVQSAIRILGLEHERFAEFGQVVGRDIGRHAHCDSRRAIGEQVGETCRKNHRLFHLTIKIFGEVHGFAVDISQHFHRKRVQPSLGIPIGRRRIAVDGSEITLTVHQGVTERKILGHAHHRLVDRAVSVGVVVLEDLADYTHGFLVGAAGKQSFLVHRIQNATMNRLQAIANIG